MDKSELAMLMLEWEKKNHELHLIELKIGDEVMQLKQTFVVGNVRATYSDGRRSFDYESTARVDERCSQQIIDIHTKPVIDWKAICEALDIAKENIVVLSKTEPSVSIKLDKEKAV